MVGLKTTPLNLEDANHSHTAMFGRYSQGKTGYRAHFDLVLAALSHFLGHGSWTKPK